MNAKEAQQQQPLSYFRADLKNPLRNGQSWWGTGRDSTPILTGREESSDYVWLIYCSP